eukprot:TRINITY_DN4539_c0_g1_i1.p1 TRINITY_DN4539_c0_g1~~TRINITY_DN4539_c0_g1_i1.p1  ORF type:complete len:380 (-),score=49.17 TRINITY_DN4539_c0_g1_i1:55-1194(-)
MESQEEVSLLLRHMLKQTHLKSTYLLFVGMVSGMCAFGFAGFLGIYKYKNHDLTLSLNLWGDPLKSGKSFHPMTVSEMVHDPLSEEGKVWTGFCIVGAVCILLSAYPFFLQNVYIGDDLPVPFTKTPAIYLRMFLPPTGMLLVCCITVTQGARDFSQKIAAGIHIMGATVMIGGYMVFEVHALWWSKVVTMKEKEQRIRKAIIIVCGICSVGFQVCGMLLGKLNACGELCSCDSNALWSQTCTDQWVIPTRADVDQAQASLHEAAYLSAGAAYERQTTLLANSASGWVLNLKQANYWFEVFAGATMLASHFVIWYYCKERHVKLDADIPVFSGDGHPWDYVANSHTRYRHVTSGSTLACETRPFSVMSVIRMLWRWRNA